MRRLLVCGVLLVLALLVLLFGCSPGSSKRARQDVVNLGEETRSEAVAVFEAIARGVGATQYSGSGSTRYSGCADLLANEISYRAQLVILDTNVSPERQPQIVEPLVRKAGWTIYDRAPGGIDAEKDGLYLSVSYDRGGLDVDVRTDCVKAGRRVVEEFETGSLEKLGLEPPAEPLR